MDLLMWHLIVSGGRMPTGADLLAYALILTLMIPMLAIACRYIPKPKRRRKRR